MSYRKKRNNTESKPLTLSDGTEVYEISESFSVNSLIDISFSRSRPVRSRHQAEYNRLDGFIIQEPINTQIARLNYIGCTLIPPDNNINKSINNTFNDNDNKLYKNSNKENIIFNKKEIPINIYNKLLNQLGKFAKDLNQYDTNDDIDRSNILLLTKGIKLLNNTLKQIGNEEKYKYILNKDYNPYNHTNNKLNDIINKLNGNKSSISQPTDDDDDDDDDDDNNNNNNDNSWLLYQKNKLIKTSGTCDAQYLDLESRISKLENCIGFVTDMKNPYPDTLNAVDLLQSRFEFVFGSSWGNIKQHANKMMNDLKNIKYHLDLMQARYKPTQKEIRMEWEKLEDLWIMMNKWDKVVFQLINIVKRLKSLQNYHYRTCLFIKRVNKIYNQQCFIYQSLKNDSKILQNVVKSLDENTKMLQQNSDYLIQRLNVIEAKI